VKEDPMLVQHILSFFADHMKSVSTEQSASSHQGAEKSELLERQGTTGWLSSPVQNSPSKSSAQETPVLGFTQESDAKAPKSSKKATGLQKESQHLLSDEAQGLSLRYSLHSSQPWPPPPKQRAPSSQVHILVGQVMGFFIPHRPGILEY
jgi:hypothetical protein